MKTRFLSQVLGRNLTIESSQGLEIIAELKRLTTYHEEELADAVPEAPEDFKLTLIAFIGPVGTVGADMFFFDVFSPSQAKSAQCVPYEFGPKVGEMLVPVFDPVKIRKAVQRAVDSVEGDTYSVVANKLSRILFWEYSGYRPGDGEKT